MSKLAIMCIAMILAAQFVFSASAVSATSKGFVDDSLFVTYNFAGFNESVYGEIKSNPQFNETTIPEAIVDSMISRNLKQVAWTPSPVPIIYDDDNRTIDVSFYLRGTDVVSYSVNQTSINRNYKVMSDWQKFDVNLASSVSVNFIIAFNKAISEWQRINYTDASQKIHPAFYYRNNETSIPDVSFYLVLPSAALNVQVNGDTVTFEMPVMLGDQLLSSPLLVLAAIIIVLVIVLLYRKAR
jgi:hypothetical protein